MSIGRLVDGSRVGRRGGGAGNGEDGNRNKNGSGVGAARKEVRARTGENIEWVRQQAVE